MRPRLIPEAEIRFAAKSGFLTKGLWNEFFAEGGDRWRRMQWAFLSERHIFKPHRSSRASNVVVLNPKNTHVQKLVGNEISAAPFVAQLDHDELVARSLLQLSQTKAISDYQTESELRRLFPLIRNRYRPKEREKYPDAIVQVTRGPKVALELELTLKARRRYRQVLRTYRSRKDVGRIVFIVRSAVMFESITQAIKDTYYPLLERPIGFAWLEDWSQNPARARIDFKSTSTSVLEMTGLKSDFE